MAAHSGVLPTSTQYSSKRRRRAPPPSSERPSSGQRELGSTLAAARTVGATSMLATSRRVVLLAPTRPGQRTTIGILTLGTYGGLLPVLSASPCSPHR